MSIDTNTTPDATTETTKVKKVRTPRVPNTVPAVVSFPKLTIAAELADKYRDRLASEWDAFVAKSYNAYCDAAKSAGSATLGKRAWRKDVFSVEAKDFASQWKSEKLAPLYDWFNKYAIEAQSMTFEKVKSDSAAVRNSLALSASILSELAVCLTMSGMRIASGRLSREDGLRELNELIARKLGDDASKTNFDGVVSNASNSAADWLSQFPSLADDLHFLFVGSGMIDLNPSTTEEEEEEEEEMNLDTDGDGVPDAVAGFED